LRGVQNLTNENAKQKFYSYKWFFRSMVIWDTWKT